MKFFVCFVCAPFSQVFSGNTMIFGNRNGKPSEKCRKSGSGQFECEVKRKEKTLLAIPENYQRAKPEPSLLITETGTFISLDESFLMNFKALSRVFRSRILLFQIILLPMDAQRHSKTDFWYSVFIIPFLVLTILVAVNGMQWVKILNWSFKFF